jgi:hypothetical protein
MCGRIKGVKRKEPICPFGKKIDQNLAFKQLRDAEFIANAMDSDAVSALLVARYASKLHDRRSGPLATDDRRFLQFRCRNAGLWRAPARLLLIPGDELVEVTALAPAVSS